MTSGFLNKSFLIIDDDISLGKSLKVGLLAGGAKNVFLATDGRSGIKTFEEKSPDLVLLDIRMPILDGWETAKYLRWISNIPIIMLTSLSSDENVLTGLNLGAVDYIAKPFNKQVLHARIESALRNYSSTPESNCLSIIDDGYLELNLETRQVCVAKKHVKLSTTEYDLLKYFAANPNRCIAYHELLENVWGETYSNQTDYTRVYVSSLRRKIELDPKKPKYFITEYRRGYRFVVNTD